MQGVVAEALGGAKRGGKEGGQRGGACRRQERIIRTPRSRMARERMMSMRKALAGEEGVGREENVGGRRGKMIVD